jgi:hypothetical protein
MASTQFVAVGWQPNQLLDEDSLDALSNNLIYLRDEMVDGTYTNLNGAVVSTGLKLLCGRAIITGGRNTDTATIRVNFASVFTAGTNPVVTTSITSANKVQVFSVINGIGQFHPDHQGFECKVQLDYDSKKKDKIKSQLCVNWIAMGL